MTTISDGRLAEMIIAAYRRGHAWCLENPGSEEYLAKAAYDYADKALSSLEASPAPVSEEMANDAQFLIDRLDDFERGSLCDTIEDACRDFDGHVSPAIERLRAALAAKGGQ